MTSDQAKAANDQTTGAHEETLEFPASTRLAVTMLGALPPWRGVAPYTRHLVEALEAEEELDVEFLDFVSLYPPRLYPGGDPIDRTGTRPSFRRVRVRRMLAWYNPFTWLWAGLTLRGRIVHAQWWSFILAPVYLAVLGLARLRGRKVVLTLHNVLPHEGGRWQRWLYRGGLRFAHHFIVHSQRSAETLAAVYPAAAGRVTVVPHGLLRATKTRELPRQEARRQMGLPADRLVILAFGNIRPYKGLAVLLQAFRQVLSAEQEAILVVAGQPWRGFEPYQRIIDDLSLGANVRTWLEFVPEGEVEAIFAAADLAVFPYTHFDAQSGAATLALSFGLPILVSDVGGLPDLVNDPRAVVPANDSAALAEAILAVLADATLRAKLATDARRTAAQLGWESIAQKTVAVYRALACAPLGRLPELEAAEGRPPDERR